MLRIVPIVLFALFAKPSLSLSVSKPMQISLPTPQVRNAYQSTYTCSSHEDRTVGVERFSADSDLDQPLSFGFLFMVLGSRAELTAELSIACLRAAFGNSTNITLARPRAEYMDGCLFWNGQTDPCWVRLMTEKVHAAISSPYDITVMLDVDVFANPNFALKGQVIPTLSRMFQSHKWDIVFAEALTSYTWNISVSTYNGGFVAFRRSASTERFFNCVLNVMENTGQNEQDAYSELLKGPNMTSLRATRLPAHWQCRGASLPGGTFTTNLEPDHPHACIFSHAHYKESKKALVQELCGATQP